MSKSLKLIIESMLFSSEKPLTMNDIHSCLPDVETSEIKSAIEILKYEIEGMERSFELKEVAKGYQLRSRPEYGAYILRMLQKSPNRLSRAAMETLAIIAYKQPILRQEIERLRGVDVGGIIRTLLEKGLIRIMGRKDLPGKPLIYGTTKLFLETFDLKDLASLPKLKEIKNFGAEDYEPSSTSEDNNGTDQQEGKKGDDVSSGLLDESDGSIDHIDENNEDVSNEISEQGITEYEIPIKEDEQEDVQERGSDQESEEDADLKGPDPV